MNVWMAASSTGNPYMDLLVEHLRGRGVHVEDGIEPQRTIWHRAMVDGPPDVLHLHWLNVFFLRGGEGPMEYGRVAGRTANFGAMLAALRAAGTTIVWTAHNLGNHEEEMWFADAVCHATTARLADAIVAHSPRAAQRVADAFPVGDERKIEVVPHGHYIDVYRDDTTRAASREWIGVGDDERVFLYLGRIRPYKNVPELIRRFRRADTGDEARLVVAGSASDEALERDVRDAAAGAGDVDLHLQFIPDENLQYYSRAADVAVLPYRDILTSGSAVLAMSFGLPVVAPRLGTLRDLVDDEGGVLYDPEGGEALEDALESAAATPRARLAGMGRSNRDRASEWDWERVARETLAAYGGGDD